MNLKKRFRRRWIWTGGSAILIWLFLFFSSAPETTAQVFEKKDWMAAICSMAAGGKKTVHKPDAMIRREGSTGKTVVIKKWKTCECTGI